MDVFCTGSTGSGIGNMFVSDALDSGTGTVGEGMDSESTGPLSAG